MVNKDWNHTCPKCRRHALTVYPTGMARCNRCWHSSTRFTRWVAGHESLLNAVFIGIILFAFGVAWGVFG